jgi:hypothetical protein
LLGEAQAVVGQDTGDTAAGSDAGSGRTRIADDMCDITYYCRCSNQQKITPLAQNVLAVVTENDDKVQITE